MKTQSSKSALFIGLSIALTMALSGCVGGPQRPRGPPAKVINRVLATAPGEAQPSAIVKTEVAYRQAAEANGLFAAASDYAASGALTHSSSAPLPFGGDAREIKGVSNAEKWGPRTVVVSCTGSLALSAGRFRDKDGKIGSYVTEWTRQRDNTYKWSYDTGALDNPQPPPRPDFGDGDIVVTAIDSVFGLIADCPPPDPGPRPPLVVANTSAYEERKSADGSLVWSWEQRADGVKIVRAHYYYQGGWEEALEERLASPVQE